MLVRDFTDGLEVDQVLLVRTVETRARRDGGEELTVTFADRSGTVAAVVSAGTGTLQDLCRCGEPMRVAGTVSVIPGGGRQIELRAVRPATEGTYAAADLTAGPARTAEAMEGALRALVATVQDPHLAALLDRLLGPGTETWSRYREAPAAKRYHHAYRHGLLEHSLSVAEGVSAVASAFGGGIDRDVAITGALLHDIGKLDAYATGPAGIELTDLGRLQGEIPLGYYRVRRGIEAVQGFPRARAEALLHVILSHHGSLEHGSPVVPCTREATLVHFLDNLGGRLGTFDRLEQGLAPGAAWSAFDRVIGGGAFFGFAAPAPPVDEPASADATRQAA